MVNVAKNGQWKAWVRQAAAEYACRFMDVGTICIELLSGLHGKLFYWTAEQFIDTRDKRLKDQLRNYARYYTGQEMQQDVCLVKMQDKDGVRRICGYLERLFLEILIKSVVLSLIFNRHRLPHPRNRL